jgi:hypothetical protein
MGHTLGQARIPDLLMVNRRQDTMFRLLPGIFDIVPPLFTWLVLRRLGG